MIKSPKFGDRECYLDDEDYVKITSYGGWTLDKDGYAIKTIKCDTTKSGFTTLKMHRIVSNAPQGIQVDHENRNKLDNRKSNLRFATGSQNRANQEKYMRNGLKPASQYKGVDWVKQHKRWRARVRVDREEIYLGHFKSEQEAARAYDKKALEIFGEYANINFKEET